MNLVVDDCIEMSTGGQQNPIGMVVSTLVFHNGIKHVTLPTYSYVKIPTILVLYSAEITVV